MLLTDLDPAALDVSGASVNGATPAEIAFVNELKSAVDIYWINYSGARVFYRTLPAATAYLQPTYLTHPWIVALAGSGDTLAQGTGTLLDGFLASTPNGSARNYDIALIRGAYAPEPEAWVLMILGLAGVGAVSRRRMQPI